MVQSRYSVYSDAQLLFLWIPVEEICKKHGCRGSHDINFDSRSEDREEKLFKVYLEYTDLFVGQEECCR